MWEGGEGGREKVKVSEVEIVYLSGNVSDYVHRFVGADVYLWDERG